jgi:hypothetical protein
MSQKMFHLSVTTNIPPVVHNGDSLDKANFEPLVGYSPYIMTLAIILQSTRFSIILQYVGDSRLQYIPCNLIVLQLIFVLQTAVCGGLQTAVLPRWSHSPSQGWKVFSNQKISTIL